MITTTACFFLSLPMYKTANNKRLYALHAHIYIHTHNCTCLVFISLLF